jgi:hypothetical protein
MKIEIGDNLAAAIVAIAFGILMILAGFAFSATAHGQAVEILTPYEAQTAQRLHLEQERLNAEWAMLNTEIIRTHLEANQNQTTGCVVNQMLIKFEWGCAEFVYSTHFNAIVPAKVLTSPPYGATLYELSKLGDGNAIAITEKPVLEEDENGYHWVWNAYHNSENYPNDAHKYKEPQN